MAITPHFSTLSSRSSIYSGLHFIAAGESSLGVFNSASEAQTKVSWEQAGAFSGMYCRVTANNVTAASTVNIRLNGANGNQTISVGSGMTGEFTDAVHFDTIASGTTVNYQLIVGSGGTAFIITALRLLFSASANTVKNFGESGSTLFGSSGLWFMGLAGDNGTDANESRITFKIKTAGTLSGLSLTVTSNTRNVSTTYGCRVNGASSPLSISVSPSMTGLFTDAVDTQSVGMNSFVNFYVSSSSGSGTINWNTSGVEFTTTSGQTHAIAGNGGFAIGANGMAFFPIGGDVTGTSLEQAVQVQAGVAYTASKLATNIFANGVTAPSTMTFRRNGADGNQIVSIAASTTGYFEDTDNSDTVAATDEVNYQIVAGATGTTLTPLMVGHLITVQCSCQ